VRGESGDWVRILIRGKQHREQNQPVSAFLPRFLKRDLPQQINRPDKPLIVSFRDGIIRERAERECPPRVPTFSPLLLVLSYHVL